MIKVKKKVKLFTFILLLLLLGLFGFIYSNISNQPKVRLTRALTRLNKEAELLQNAFYGDLGLDEVWKEILEGEGSGQASVNLSLPFLSSVTLGLDGPYAWNAQDKSASWQVISSVTHIELLQARFAMDETYFYAEVPELLSFPLKGQIETVLPGFSEWRDMIWNTEADLQKSMVTFLEELIRSMDIQSFSIESVDEQIDIERDKDHLLCDVIRVRSNKEGALTQMGIDFYLDETGRLVRISLPEAIPMSPDGVEMVFTLELYDKEDSIQEFGGSICFFLQDGRTVTVTTTERIQIDREDHAFSAQVSLEGITRETLTFKLQGRFTEAIMGESVTLEIGKLLLEGQETTYIQVAGKFQIVQEAEEVLFPEGSKDFYAISKQEQTDVQETLEENGMEWLSQYGIEKWEW